MKNLILFSLLTAVLFSSCKKDEIDLNKVDSIVISGRFVSSETGEPLSLSTLTGSLHYVVSMRYRTPNSIIPNFLPNDVVKPDGSYQFKVDSAAAFIEKQGINFYSYANNFTTCDANLIRCSRQPLFKMPFSIFEQKQEGSTLFLTYNIKLIAQASVSFAMTGLQSNDSLRVGYEYINPCSGSQSMVEYGQKIPTLTGSFPYYYGLGQFTPNRDYKVKFSLIRDGSIVKTQEWQGLLAPLETLYVSMKMD
jgi:hypothetical protein